LKRSCFLGWIFGDLTGHSIISIALCQNMPRSGGDQANESCAWDMLLWSIPKEWCEIAWFACEFGHALWSQISTLSLPRANSLLQSRIPPNSIDHIEVHVVGPELSTGFPVSFSSISWGIGTRDATSKCIDRGLSSIPSPVPVVWPLFRSARILGPATHAGCASFGQFTGAKPDNDVYYEIPIIPIIHTMASSIIL
jgi:hypothetical protein